MVTLISSHLISSHLISSHLISSHLALVIACLDIEMLHRLPYAIVSRSLAVLLFVAAGLKFTGLAWNPSAVWDCSPRPPSRSPWSSLKSSWPSGCCGVCIRSAPGRRRSAYSLSLRASVPGKAGSAGPLVAASANIGQSLVCLQHRPCRSARPVCGSARSRCRVAATPSDSDECPSRSLTDLPEWSSCWGLLLGLSSLFYCLCRFCPGPLRGERISLYPRLVDVGTAIPARGERRKSMSSIVAIIRSA